MLLQSFVADPVSMQGRSNLNNMEMAYARQVGYDIFFCVDQYHTNTVSRLLFAAFYFAIHIQAFWVACKE